MDAIFFGYIYKTTQFAKMGLQQQIIIIKLESTCLSLQTLCKQRGPKGPHYASAEYPYACCD